MQANMEFRFSEEKFSQMLGNRLITCLTTKDTE